MSKEMIIQLGLPKTGTTTLQNRIYQKHPDYLYLGKHNQEFTPDARSRDRWILKFIRNLVSKDLPFFQNYKFEDILINEFGDLYKKHDKLFLSEESILGRCITRGYYKKFVRISSAYYSTIKLKEVFDNDSFSKLKIILIIRRQDDIIESYFAEEYQGFKKFYSINNPEEFIEFLFKDGFFEESDSMFRYSSLIQHLDRLFGSENVLVLPYEKLKNDPVHFLQEISSFMQISPWKDVHLIKEKRDNYRGIENRQGKIAKVTPLRLKMAKLKNSLIGDVATGLGNKMKFLDEFQKSKIISMNNNTKNEVLLKYRDDNIKLKNRVKYIEEYNYY